MIQEKKNTQFYDVSLCKTTMEDSNPRICPTSLIPQADESSPLSMLSKSVAANTLQELAEKLQLLARCETGFLQGFVNELTCSWRDPSEGTDYHKWPQKSLVYRQKCGNQVKPSLREVKSGVLTSKCTECEITAIRREQCKKSFGLPACTTKEKRKPETAPNMALESKAPAVQDDAGQAPITISFSLSSNICEERDWIFQISDSSSEDIHQQAALCVDTGEARTSSKPNVTNNTVTVMFHQEGSLVTNKNEEMVRDGNGLGMASMPSQGHAVDAIPEFTELWERKERRAAEVIIRFPICHSWSMADHLIDNQMSVEEQITVACVIFKNEQGY